jgi:PilZ domain-containing protein
MMKTNEISTACFKGRCDTKAALGQKGGRTVTHIEWEWPIGTDLQKHNERVALLRPIPYEMTTQLNGESDSTRSRKALSVNISSGGMLVLMDQAPEVEQVLKVLVPTPTSLAGTPTLAEVRWTRRLPFSPPNGPSTYFVGLKFMF